MEEYTDYVESGKEALKEMGLVIEELDISTASSAKITNKLQNTDYIYISGGNTFFLLQEIKRTGTDMELIKQINSGKIYIGESAGSIVVSPDIEYAKDMDDSNKASELSSFAALNLVDFYPVPHHTNFPFEEAVEIILSKYSTTLKLYPISNSQMIVVNDETVEQLNG